MFLLNEHKTNRQKIYYTLRIAAAMCFIGHGAFGIITKSIWSNYFAVFGIGRHVSFQLMPIVGSIDILMGIIILIYPLRAVVAWLVVWGMITALLRPLSGEPFAEFIERAGNFGAPLALIILCGGAHFKKMFAPIKPEGDANYTMPKYVAICLRIVVFLIFIGHGWLNITEKKGLITEYTMFGFGNPGDMAQFIGCLEIAAALSVLIKPVRSLILILFIWKIISEFFYPRYELFEWIERGGSYGAILALWFTLGEASALKVNDTATKSFRYYMQKIHYVVSNGKAYTKIPVFIFIIFSCNNKNNFTINNKHVESLAKDFMKTDVIPHMKDPKPYEVAGAKVVVKTVADKINDYRFTYDHLSFNHQDSIENKNRLDSIIKVSLHPDSIISITVNVAYKTRYKYGNVVTDSIKLGYNPEKDKISYWPF